MTDCYDALVGHIDANLGCRIRVDDLAAIARLSVRELARALRRDHATTPYGLVLFVRIGRARAMLGEGATIADTAIHTGFADQSHFTRHFKRITGMTPMQYASQGEASSATGRRGDLRLRRARSPSRSLHRT